MMRALHILMMISALSLSAQESTESTINTDSSTTIPKGVVPTPAQTDNPKLLGFGMVIVGLAMGFILFGRRSKSDTASGGQE